MSRTFLLLSIICCHACFASDVPYAVKNISPVLLKDANVVKRTEVIRFEVINSTKTKLNYKYAFTILNENGDKYASLVEYYDNLRKIESIEGTLYDADGKVLKKLKSKDIQDLSGVSDISLMDDNRNKAHSFYHKIYPYTVEYEVEVNYNNTFHFPGWITQEGQHIAVEESNFTFICPANYQFRYKALNYNKAPVETTDKEKKSYYWQVKDLPAVITEPYAPRWHELTTMLSLAPNDFEVEGFKGNMATWKDFGKFLYELKKGKDVLPLHIKNQVKELTANAKSDQEKIKILYDFLQQNTRYISIQLGIGGWQPFDAEYVATKRYGDCKALSNYMYSLLKEVNIKSQYALIKSGKQEHYLMEDFPSNQFNHAILCVPLLNDTMWLECTSQTVPAGYMGNFTGNRKALLVDENGGTLVNTPRYGLAENQQVRMAKGKLDEEGALIVKVDTRYLSIQQDELHDLINGLSKQKVKETLQEYLDLATYDISEFKYVEHKDAYPQIDEALQISISNYATITGKRLFLTPNLLNQSNNKLSVDHERKYDLCFTYAYNDIDSVEIEIPNGYSLESILQPVNLKSKFGNYSSYIKVEGTKVKYIRTRQQFEGRFPSSDYSDLEKYYAAIYKADRGRIVFVKKEN